MDLRLHWLARTLADIPEGDAWLGARERAILSRLRFSKRRSDWRLGRWTAKCALLAFRPDDFPAMPALDILAAEDGGPEAYASCGGAVDVSLSISHSHGRGLCAVAPGKCAVGCDLERIERKSLDFFNDYFTPREISFCRRARPDDYPVACYLVWSAKEASLKILREGLRRDTRSIEIEAEFPAGEGAWRAWTGRCVDTSATHYGWWRHENGFVYALGADRAGARPQELLPRDVQEAMKRFVDGRMV